MYNMIQKQRENGKKGFTLAELLVVVAIIAVLVAISIPIFTSQLNKAKEATNDANMRAAKGAAVTEYLSEGETAAVTYYYDAENGSVTKAAAKPEKMKGYSQKVGDVAEGLVVEVSITADGASVSTAWK